MKLIKFESLNDKWDDELIDFVKSKMSKKVFKAVYKTLNKQLLIKQNVSSEQVLNLCALHWLKHQLSIYSRDLTDVDKIVQFNNFVEHVEFLAQDNWNFKRDKNRHIWWLYMEGCNCPKPDNRDMLGIEGWWRNGFCKLHNNVNYELTNLDRDDNLHKVELEIKSAT